MPIFDQGYQHWDGKVSGHAWRWWAVTKHGVRVQFRNRWTKMVVMMGIAPSLALAGFLIFWGLLEQKSNLIAPLLRLMPGLPEELRSNPASYRVTIWTLAFQIFFSIETIYAMLLVLLVGPDLVSKDLRFNALPLYLSRPVRRFDYFLGKLGVIGVFISLVTTLPLLIAYVLGAGFSVGWQVFTDTFPLLLAGLAYSAVVIVSSGTLMLAISSLSRNSRYVGAFWVGIWFISNTAAHGLTESLRDENVEWPSAVSYTNNLLRAEALLLNTEAAWRKIDELTLAGERVTAAAPMMMQHGGFGHGQSLPRSGQSPTMNGQGMQATSMPPNMPRQRSHNPFRNDYPWQYSAYVLAGLFGLSLWTLTWRVKSLDRLK